MAAGDRFGDWIKARFTVWKSDITSFVLQLLGPIGLIVWNVFRGQVEETRRDNLKAVVDDPNTSPELKALIQQAIDAADAGGEVLAWFLTIIGTVVSIVHLGGPQGRNLNYSQDRILRSYRLDPLSVINLSRRFAGKYPWAMDDLRDGGISEDRIDALMDATKAFPSLRDVIGFFAHEVFEPDMIERYGLRDELPPYEGTLFEKLGVPPDIAENYWMDHWQHASWMQVVEMLHRGLITEEDAREWFRVVEIPPYWRDLLIQTAYTWPTRVDVRRWWDMRTIDESRLRELYSGMGYRGKNLDDYVLWTKVYVAFPDLLARWSNGWITKEDVRSQLVGMGMPAARVEEMIQQKESAVEAGQVDDGKALTKTEIYKGVKKGTITRDQAVDLLMDLNYTESQAEYLLDINVGVLEGSPDTYEELKDITTKYKRAIGKEARAMPEELKQLADQVVKLAKEVETLKQSVADEEAKLIGVEELPAAATKQRDKLRRTLHRTEAELARVKTDYEAKLLEWRKGV